jgi:hypothetical protein
VGQAAFNLGGDRVGNDPALYVGGHLR